VTDLDALLAIEAAEDAERARPGDADAGERLLDSLLHWPFAGEGVGSVQSVVDLRAPYLRELRARLGIGEEPGSGFLGLLGLTSRPGRRRKSGPGSRAEAARRLRAVVDLARAKGAPEPLLAFYLTAADAIEAGAEPRRALGLRRRPGRPREGELTRAVVDTLTDEAKRRAIVQGESHLDATGIAGERGAELGRRGSSEATAQRAIKRAREKLRGF